MIFFFFLGSSIFNLCVRRHHGPPPGILRWRHPQTQGGGSDSDQDSGVLAQTHVGVWFHSPRKLFRKKVSTVYS